MPQEAQEVGQGVLGLREEGAAAREEEGARAWKGLAPGAFASKLSSGMRASLDGKGKIEILCRGEEVLPDHSSQRGILQGVHGAAPEEGEARRITT
jgi:hypothetical protein